MLYHVNARRRGAPLTRTASVFICLFDDVNVLDYLGEKLQNFSYTPTIQLAPIWLGPSLEMATVSWPGIADLL